MDNKDEMSVYIGKNKIAIIGLRSIFDELKEKGIVNEEELKDIIMQKVKENNYVPESAEKEYKDLFDFRYIQV